MSFFDELMKILVTAFGPFGGRCENASSLALRELKKTVSGLRTRVLPVDAVLAPARLKQAIREVGPDALVMLGEAGGCKGIRLETTAWNEQDFQIPDVAGRLLGPCPIRLRSPSSLPSTLPLKQIHESLSSLGHRVEYSEDPGRYLCNQLFYTALDHLQEKRVAIPAGFIHLALEENYSTARTVEALSETIVILKASLRGSFLPSLIPLKIGNWE
jgi:pyroglutamyl-peptidase